jgi:hypothetical protein
VAGAGRYSAARGVRAAEVDLDTLPADELTLLLVEDLLTDT